MTKYMDAKEAASEATVDDLKYHVETLKARAADAKEKTLVPDKELYPDKYNPDSDDFHAWRDSVEIYAGTMKRGMREALQSMRRHQVPIDEQEFKTMGHIIEYSVHSGLYSLLLQQTIGTAYMVVKSVGDDAGFEAWRLLHESEDPILPEDALDTDLDVSAMRRLQASTIKDVPALMVQLDVKANEYADTTDKQFSQETLKTNLHGMFDIETRRHMSQHAEEPYPKYKKLLQSYIKTTMGRNKNSKKGLNSVEEGTTGDDYDKSSQAESENTKDMEEKLENMAENLDALVRAGAPGGKGKGGMAHITCYNCGEKGHDSMQCTSPAKPNSHPGGKGTKGKNGGGKEPRGGCYICKGDHFRSDCPQAAGRGGKPGGWNK